MSLAPASSHPGVGDGGLQIATLTLTNAQIKALDGNLTTIVAAPGAGRALLGPPTGHGFLTLDCTTTAAVYTNVNAACVMTTYLGSGGELANYGPLTDLFGWGGRGVLALGDTARTGAGVGTVNYADIGDLPILVALFNGGAGQLTGGNVANSLTIRLGYFTVTL